LGAKRVIGIDLVQSRIDFCHSNVSQNHSGFSDILEFHCTHIESLNRIEEIDIVVSKDSFEHVIDLPKLMNGIFVALKPNGLLATGFGPLYYSYYGGHKATGAKLPWFHLIISEEILMNRINKKRNLKLEGIKDLGLNMLKYKDYLKCFDESGMEILTIKTNASTHPVSVVFRFMKKVPFLEDYFTQSIYAILQKQTS
jgi:2-polyprenyl-3-methyl-5-hydroxy-6-metoxy-1,4-benzoquinol methylase